MDGLTASVATMKKKVTLLTSGVHNGELVKEWSLFRYPDKAALLFSGDHHGWKAGAPRRANLHGQII